MANKRKNGVVTGAATQYNWNKNHVDKGTKGQRDMGIKFASDSTSEKTREIRVESQAILSANVSFELWKFKNMKQNNQKNRNK